MKKSTMRKRFINRIIDTFRVPRIVNGTVMHHRDTWRPVMRRVKNAHEFFQFYGGALVHREDQIEQHYSDPWHNLKNSIKH